MTSLRLPMFLLKQNCSTAYANYQIFYGLNWIFILIIANQQRDIIEDERTTSEVYLIKNKFKDNNMIKLSPYTVYLRVLMRVTN